MILSAIRALFSPKGENTVLSVNLFLCVYTFLVQKEDMDRFFLQDHHSAGAKHVG